MPPSRALYFLPSLVVSSCKNDYTRRTDLGGLVGLINLRSEIVDRREQTPVTRRARLMAYRFVGTQALTVILVAVFWLISGLNAFYSVLLGGLAVLVPSFGFAYGLFRTTSAQAARKIVVVFYLGEIAKIVLSGVLALAFVLFFRVDLLAFLIGFMAALLGFWVAPALVRLDVSKGNKR